LGVLVGLDNEQFKFELWGEQSGIWWVSSRVYGGGGGPGHFTVISWDWIPIPSPSPSRLTIQFINSICMQQMRSSNDELLDLKFKCFCRENIMVIQM